MTSHLNQEHFFSFEQRRFNPDMLVLAREARTLTQGELAATIDVNQNVISRWEAGIRQPSDDDVFDLSVALKRDPSFFYRTELPVSADVALMFHRKRARTRVGVLKTLHANINILRLGVASLCRQFKPWDVHVPKLEIERFSAAKEVAEKVRAQWQIPDGPVHNLVGLLEATGSIVIYFDFGTEDVDAIGMRPLDTVPLFFVNQNAPPDRIRFSLAHELGHIIMHDWPTETMEAEADEFAANFLVPEQAAKRELKSITSTKVWELKHRWKVSAQCLFRRALDVEVIDKSRHISLMSYFSKSGWRKSEPHPIASECPTFLKRLINSCIKDLKLSVNEISKITGLTSFELENYFDVKDSNIKLRVFDSPSRNAPR